MNILLYESGVAIDAIVCPDGATISDDGSTVVIPDGGATFAPAGGVWHAAPVGAGIGWSLDESGAPCAPVVVASVDALLAYAARKRWLVQTGGITVDGVAVDTSDASRSMIADAVAYVGVAAPTTVDFKGANGWVALTPQQITAIGLAVGAHVQACFSAERLVADDIASGVITTVTAIDAAPWPGEG